MFEYGSVDFSSADEIAAYAKSLEGMTFRDVLDLGIRPEGSSKDYGSASFKGGLGTLIEERYFGYDANSAQEADFAEAGVELKVTCFDVRQDGEFSAGERLVLTMIPFNGPIEDDFYESHAWEKSAKMLLVYYERDRTIDKYDQRIVYATLFTPPENDLRIIEDDYRRIAALVQAGRAQDLSESLTSYLGACTKGTSEATMWVEQYYPPHDKAKKRAFCFKRQYMDYVLHHYVMGQRSDAEPILTDVGDLEGATFEELVLARINRAAGRTDRELCAMLGLEYTGNKAQWTQITYALLGVRGNRAEEFVKANVSVRTVRIEEAGTVRESLSLNTITFGELVDESWEDAPLHLYFEETRFLFVAYRKGADGRLRLSSASFWAMPQADIDGPLRDCWQRTKDTVEKGVEFAVVPWGDGVRVENNLPKMSENPVAHVRPHTSRSWYRFADGTTLGDSPRCGDRLPDGREMTRQSFWLNSSYVYGIVGLDDEPARPPR